MGKYFNTAESRATVTKNYNRVRAMFDLNNKQVTELLQPIGNFQYTRFRRLATGDRDITPEELNAFYEALGIPPVTFIYPWTVPSKTGANNVFDFAVAAKAHNQEWLPYQLTEPNPIFTYFGESVYPYVFTNIGSWLSGQMISKIATNRFSLYRLSSSDNVREDFLQLYSSALKNYVETSFPNDGYLHAIKELTDEYDPNGDYPHMSDTQCTAFLTIFGNALLAYAHKCAYLNFLSQVTADSGTNIVSQQMKGSYRKRATAPLRRDMSETISLLRSYADSDSHTIQYEISTSVDGSSNPKDTFSVSLIQKEDRTELANIGIDFRYLDWFDFVIPTSVQPLLDRSTSKTDSGNIVYSSGNILELLESSKYSDMCFKELYPVFNEF